MEITSSKLTMLFENPFWVGIYEREFELKQEKRKQKHKGH